MEGASLQETSVILEHEMKDDPDSPDLTEEGEEEWDEKPVKVGSPKHICPECGKSLCDGFRLREHIKYIHKGAVEACLQCDKTFTRKTALRNHILFVHEGVRQHQCPTCGKFFAEKRHLKTHVASLHENTTGFKCKICNKVLKSKWSLQKHELIHTGVNPYGQGKERPICPTCGKDFLNQSTLKIHVFDKHTLQGYSKDYSKQFDLEAREKVLELMKRFGLFQVAEKLQLPAMLLRHWRQPRTRTEAVCPICGDCVSSKNLTNHMKTHEEGKPRKIHGSTAKPIKENIEDHNMKEIADYAVATR